MLPPMILAGWLLLPVATPDRARMLVAPLPPAWSAASPGAVYAPLSPPGPRVRPGAARSSLTCLRELRRLRIPHRSHRPTRGVRTPVVITGPIRGLHLGPRWGRKPALMDCRFALTLYRAAPVVLRSGFDRLLYSSIYSYRNVAGTRHLSRHAHGLAIDVYELRGPGGLKAVVKTDWVKARGRPGDCVGGVRSRKARLMRGLICNLEKTRQFHLILTPDSDYAHRDHFHLSGLKQGERPHRRTRFAGRYHRAP